MAKQHRMAVMTGASVLAILLPGWPVLMWALWVVIAGAVLTVALRSRRLIAALTARG
jgi:hypothetical protein